MSFLSSFSLVFGTIPKLVDMLYSWFKKKTDEKHSLQNELTRLETALAKALREGRITDAAALSSERNDVLKRLEKIV